MRVLLATTIIILASLAEIQSQDLVKVLKPNLKINLEVGLPLDSSSYRFFATSQQSSYYFSSESYFIDWSQDSNAFRVWYPTDSMYGRPLVYSAYSLKHLPFSNGDCILASNNFDCDIAPPCQLLYLEKNGQLRWFKDLFEKDLWIYSIKEIGIVDTNVVAFLSDGSGILYCTIDGEIVTYTTEPVIYTQPYIDQDRFYGVNEGRLVVLDELFEQVNFLLIDSLSVFQRLSANRFLLGTKNKIELVDDDLQVLAVNSTIDQALSATQIGDVIYVISSDGLHAVDMNLYELKWYEAQPAESMRFVTSRADSALVISEYATMDHKEIVARTYKYTGESVIHSINLKLESVTMPDTVFFDYPVGMYHAFVYHFDTISFLVTNLGADTIHSFNIKLDWSAHSQCSYYQDSFHVDSVSIAPNESWVYRTDKYDSDTLYFFLHGPFCFWIEMPDQQPDQEPQDDRACATTRLSVANEEIFESRPVFIYPNPVADELRIEINDLASDDLVCNVYSASGKLMDHFELADRSNTFSVHELSDGLYFLTIADHQGHFRTQKFVVAHD